MRLWHKARWNTHVLTPSAEPTGRPHRPPQASGVTGKHCGAGVPKREAGTEGGGDGLRCRPRGRVTGASSQATPGQGSPFQLECLKYQYFPPP